MNCKEFFKIIGRRGIYSNNLWLFMRKFSKKFPDHELQIHFDDENKIIYIGTMIDEEIGFIGTNLIEACCNGSKTQIRNYLQIKEKTNKKQWPEIYCKFGRNLLVALGHSVWMDGFKGNQFLEATKKLLAKETK